LITFRVTTFLEFLETWKSQGARLRSCKSQEKGSKSGEKTGMSGNLCTQGNLIVASQQNNLPVLYSFCNSFFIRDVQGEFELINVQLFDILPAISSRKVGVIAVWRVVTLTLLN